MNKHLTFIAVTAVAGLVAFTGNATAQNSVEQSDFNYTCKTGSVTVKSKTPCYVSAYGISVPGDHGAGDAAGGKDKGQDAKGSNGGVNKGGPKDLGDKPKGGGMNGKGPKGFNS